VDSGATANFVSVALVEQFSLPQTPLPSPVWVYEGKLEAPSMVAYMGKFIGNKVKEINIIIDSYKDVLINASNIIKMLDFLNSGAISAHKLGYCKPIIESHNISYLDAKELRHPIIEVINTDNIYHPHNITLGKDKSGKLLQVVLFKDIK
jgi:hypothetical protein